MRTAKALASRTAPNDADDDGAEAPAAEAGGAVRKLSEITAPPDAADDELPVLLSWLLALPPLLLLPVLPAVPPCRSPAGVASR